MCCQGSPLEMQNMQSPQVQGMMNVLGPMIAQGLGRGATPFPGQLSAGANPGQSAAMNTMMGMGGYGGYGQGGAGGGGGQGNLGPLRPPQQPNVDPYAPTSYTSGGPGSNPNDIFSNDPWGPSTQYPLPKETTDIIRDLPGGPGNMNYTWPGVGSTPPPEMPAGNRRFYRPTGKGEYIVRPGAEAALAAWAAQQKGKK